MRSVYRLYAGKETGPEPPKMLCLAQASLMRGVLPMATMASFFLVIQVCKMLNIQYIRTFPNLSFHSDVLRDQSLHSAG